MILYKLIHYIFGEYVFETDIKSFSRLANLLISEKLHFWGCVSKDRKMTFSASIFSAERIYSLAKSSNIPISIIKKKGIPFVFSKYRKRYGLFLGLGLSLFLMFYAQLFVWKINISGNNEMTTAEIENALSQCGISVGTFIPEIDNRTYANRLLMNCPRLSSAAISINGTQVFVSVLEKTPVPDFVEREGYSNVIASRDGVILDIDAADGTPMVSEGEAVYKGQLLINSFMESKNGTYRPTRARGYVYAAVRESFVTEIPMERSVICYTGNSEIKRNYEVLGWQVPSIFGLETEYEYFDAITAERWIKLFGFIELPIKEYRVVYNEYVLETMPIDEEYAEILARGELDAYLDDLDLELLECNAQVSFDKEKGVCRLRATALLKQDIGLEVTYDIRQMISDKLPIPRE